jgi:hypothetical protein
LDPERVILPLVVGLPGEALDPAVVDVVLTDERTSDPPFTIVNSPDCARIADAEMLPMALNWT